VVIDIDKVNQRISLGIKQLTEDPWKTIDQKYKIGDLVKGTVTKLASFGAFVQLQDDIDGLVHISQLSEDHVAKVKDVLKVGQEVEARVEKDDEVIYFCDEARSWAITPRVHCNQANRPRFTRRRVCAFMFSCMRAFSPCAV